MNFRGPLQRLREGAPINEKLRTKGLEQQIQELHNYSNVSEGLGWAGSRAYGHQSKEKFYILCFLTVRAQRKMNAPNPISVQVEFLGFGISSRLLLSRLVLGHKIQDSK